MPKEKIFPIDDIPGVGGYDRAPALLAQWVAFDKLRAELLDYMSYGKGRDVLQQIAEHKITVNEAVSTFSSDFERIQKKVHNI